MNRSTKAKYSLFAFIILTIVTSFVFSNSPAHAKKRGCSARFTVGRQTTPFIYLGKVGGFKKRKCKNKAVKYVREGALTLGQLGIRREACQFNPNGFTVFVDTEVHGKKRSRDAEIRDRLDC